jgi:hypothetical protein
MLHCSGFYAQKNLCAIFTRHLIVNPHGSQLAFQFGKARFSLDFKKAQNYFLCTNSFLGQIEMNHAQNNHPVLPTHATARE